MIPLKEMRKTGLRGQRIKDSVLDVLKLELMAER